MTVLIPWPGPIRSAGPQAGDGSPLGAAAPGRVHWRGLRSVAGALAPRAPRPLSLAGGVSELLSAAAKDEAGPRRHVLNLRAGMAELVLLNRLRARTRRELCVDTLERAARIIEVTARSWWGEEGGAPEAA